MVRLSFATLVFVIIAVVAAVQPSQPAFGAVILVEQDEDDFQVSGLCTLRDAILSANNDTNASGDCVQGNGIDTIQVPAGTYELDGFDFGGPLELTEDVHIVGDGADVTFIDGVDSIRVLHVKPGTTVSMDGVTLRNGLSGVGGGAIFNSGDLTLTDVTIDSNQGSFGGGINNVGRLVLVGSTISGNNATSIGGGIYSQAAGMLEIQDSEVSGNMSASNTAGIHNIGEMTIQASTIQMNQSGGNGGGIGNSGTGTIVDSRISGNTSANSGGGIYNNDTLTVQRTLISGNTGGSGGGGISTTGDVELTNVTLSGNEGGGITQFVGAGGQVMLLNVTVAENTHDDQSLPLGIYVIDGDVSLRNTTVTGADPARTCGVGLTGVLTSQGHNLEDGQTCGLDMDGDQPGVDPMLGPLADNGGPTFTHALIQGSPAIDAGDDAVCPVDDQRGEPRPQGDGCDAGAFESPFAAPTASPSATPSSSPTPTSSTSATPTMNTSDTIPPTTATATPLVTAVVWGDDNCSGEADPIDSLLTLRHDAGLSTNTGDCPNMGEVVEVADASPHPWGDVDCSGGVDPVDSLKLLRFDAGLPVTQEDGCPLLGADVLVS
ncbi:MAG: choice-of-anchor Q domain-containing protein [Dehalococcoidia bacterium]